MFSVRLAYRLISPLICLFLISCSEENQFGGEQPDGSVVHPIADSIPYFDRDHIPIDTSRSIDEMEDRPEEFATLAGYLNEPGEFDHRELEIFVGGTLHVASVGENRLVMLDKRNNRLLEYNLGLEEKTSLADKGQGPGDIELAEDMAQEGQHVYVAMQMGRVARFDCEPVPCEFDREINPDFRLRSVASIDDSMLAVVMAGWRGEEFEEGQPVRLVGGEEHASRSLGTAYRTEHTIVRIHFTQGAMVRYDNTSNRILIAYRDLPILYAYGEDGELRETYEIEFYMPPNVEHRPDAGGRIRIDNQQERSAILDVIPLGEGVFIALVQSRQEDSRQEDSRIDYYAVDVAEGQSYHVGKMSLGEGSIIPSKLGFISSDRGELSFVSY